jgi:hypothetical protein
MIVLEGAFRKWVSIFETGMGKYLMYFSKDIIFAALLFFPKRSPPSNALRTFQSWLMPGCALLVIGALLSSADKFNAVGALLTTRSCIILPILVLVAAPRLAGLPLRRVALLLAAFTILNFPLSVVQNRLSPDHVLNRYSDPEMEVVATETGVRATGTFSYITGVSILSSVGIWASLTLMSLAQTFWHRSAAWATLASAFGCAMASVSRAPLVVGVAMTTCWLIFARKGVTTMARGLIPGFFLVVVASQVGITPFFSELGKGVVERVETSSDTLGERVFGQLVDISTALQIAPMGEGFGTHQVGGNYAVTGEMDNNTIEGQLPRMILETGIVGLIGYCIVCAGALLALQRAKLDATSGEAKAALLATQTLLAAFFYGDLIFGHVSSAFTWMILTTTLAAVELNSQSQAATIPILR